MNLKRHARLVGLVILAAVTLYGIRELASGDWQAVGRHWRETPWMLPLALMWSILDVTLECTAWMWVYSRLGVRIWSGSGVAAYLTGRAGLLLPAQLNRLIRPDSVVSLGKAPAQTCLKAEAVTFVLDAASVMALLAGLLAFRIHPLAALAAVLGVMALTAGLGNWIAGRLLHTPLRLPPGLWWSWQTAAILLIEMAGWMTSGMALWVMLGSLPSDLSLGEVMFYSAGSSVLGVSTGLPGGIGATELLLGITLRLQQLGADYLVVVIGGYRAVTFWIWIPIGWLALAYVRRLASASAPASTLPPDSPDG